MRLVFAILILLSMMSCFEDTYSPKPRAFPKINFPDGKLVGIDLDYCPFSFKAPEYFTVDKDTLFFNEQPKNECWFDLNNKDLGARLHFTYFKIENKESFEKLRNDTYRLTNKHNQRADFIEEHTIDKTDNVKGTLFNLEGPAASPLQFYLTDEKDHFFRGALYFNTKTAPDSLAPAVNFLREDVLKMIETFNWKK